MHLSGLFDESQTLFSVGAFQAHNDRDLEVNVPGRGNNSLGHDVAADDAAEDVNQDHLHIFVGKDDLECIGHRLLVSCSTNVQEVCRFTTSQLDDIHGCHCQPGAVDHAAHLAVQLDVGKTVLRSLYFGWLLFGQVPQFIELGMPVEGVVVEVELGVQCHDATVFGNDEGVDLGKGAVLLNEKSVKFHDKGCRRRCRLAFHAQPVREVPGLVGHEAHPGVSELHEDLLGSLSCHLFDLHTALGAGHKGDLFGSPVNNHSEIKFRSDPDSPLYDDLAHDLAFRSRLVGDEGLAEHFFGSGFRLGRAINNLDASTHTAASSVDLGFNDHPAAELFCNSDDLVGRSGNSALGYGDTILLEKPLGLIFMDFHAVILLEEQWLCV